MYLEILRWRRCLSVSVLSDDFREDSHFMFEPTTGKPMRTS